MKYTILILLVLIANITKGQKILGENQHIITTDKDTVIYTGEIKSIQYKEQNEKNNVKPSRFFLFYDENGILAKLGGWIISSQIKDNEYLYFDAPIEIINENDSLYISVKKRYLYKSQMKAISKLNTGKKAFSFSDSEIIFKGKTTPEYLYLTCEGLECVNKYLILKKLNAKDLSKIYKKR